MKGKGDRQPPELFDKPDEVLNRLQQYIADLTKQFQAKPTEAQFQKMADTWNIEREYYKRASKHNDNENQINPVLIHIGKKFAKYYHNVIMPQQRQQPYEVQGGMIRRPPEVFEKLQDIIDNLKSVALGIRARLIRMPNMEESTIIERDWRNERPFFIRAYKHYENDTQVVQIKNIIIVTDNMIHQYYRFLQQQNAIAGGGVIEDITNVAKTVIKKGKKAIETVKAVVFGTTDLPSKVKTILKKYGNEEIVDAVIKRTPVPKLLTSALSAVSLGAFGKKFSDSPYDKLFHLYIDFTLKSGTHISLEKNEVITMTVNPKDRPKEESQKVSIPANKTLNNILESTEKSMGKEQFIGYSAKDNNCQDFLVAVLKSNSMGDSNTLEFVKQDTRQLFEGMDYLRKFANTITDIGARVNVITSGEGISDSQFFDSNNVKSVDFPQEMKGEGQGEKRKAEYSTSTPPRQAPLSYQIGNEISTILNEELNEDTHNEFMRSVYRATGRNSRENIIAFRERFINWLGGAHINPQQIQHIVGNFDRFLRYEPDNTTDTESIDGGKLIRTKYLGKRGGAAIQQIGEASLLRSWVGSEDKKILNRIVHSADEDPHSSAGRTGYNEFADVVGYFDPQAQEALQYVIHNPKNKGLRVRDSKVKEAVKQISQYQKPPPKRQGKGIKISTDNKMPKFVKGSQEAKDYMAAMRAKRGTKKGGDLIGDLKAIGSKMGEPFKAIAGANPFEMGYDLGFNIIGPAIAGKGMCGKGICGICNKEFAPRNMMRHYVIEHTPEEAMKQILASGERDRLSKYKTSNFGLVPNHPRLAPFKAHIEKTINEFNPNMFETAGAGIKKKGKLIKGSQEAKDYMAAMRAKRGKKMKGGDAFTDFFTKTIPSIATSIATQKKDEYVANPQNALADVIQYSSSYTPKIPGTNISPEAAFIRAPGQMRGMGRYMC